MTTTSISNYVPSAAPDLQSLKNRVAGEVLTGADQGYDEARKVHDISVDRNPWVIVRAAKASDVVEAVRFARHHGLPLAVKSGGHSIAGYSAVDGSITVDLSAMRGVSIDPESRTARVEPGATSGDLAGPAHAYGLALTTGDVSTVGIGGLTIGGGIGWMVRKYGLTIDSLLSVQIVTADGRLIKASEKQHSDLFWAVRGGGGNFGIVTEFEFRMAPVGSVYGGALVLPGTREVIRGVLELADQAPDELTTINFLMQGPPAPFIPEEWLGKPVFMVIAAYAGDMEDGEKALAPFRALAEPIADLVGPIPYPVLYEFTADGAAPHAASVRQLFADYIPDEVIDGTIDAIANATSPTSMINYRILGGAMARVAPGETAFAHRDRKFFVAVIGLWFDASEDAGVHRAWTEAAFEQMRSIGVGVYSNFLEREGEDRIHEAYPGETYRRLSEVKKQYDPANFFHFNQNIRPAK